MCCPRASDVCSSCSAASHSVRPPSLKDNVQRVGSLVFSKRSAEVSVKQLSMHRVLVVKVCSEERRIVHVENHAYSETTFEADVDGCKAVSVVHWKDKVWNVRKKDNDHSLLCTR